MALPVIVLVGRPNVGKSSLLNALARQRISIVDPRPGITRDRVSAIIEHQERYLELVDTGGIGIVDSDHLEAHVEGQIQFALTRAEVIVFVVDVNDGVAPLDQRVAELLRPLNRPVIVAANKCDAPSHDPLAGEFNRLGFGAPICTSAQHGLGRDALLERILAVLGPLDVAAPTEPVMKLAIVGKRNAGKSTLVNALAGEPRMIVSEVPGTTRDAVDVRFERDGRVFVAIDTAGVRKKSSMQDVDFYSYVRALAALRRADVVMHLIDATVPVSEVDLKLSAAVLEEHKPLVLVINKWDLAEGRSSSAEFGDYLAKVMPHVSYAPIVLVTAKTGKNVDAAVDVALSLHRQSRTRISTGQLNQTLTEILEHRAPTPKQGAKSVKIYYATQISVAPPTIVCFCNDPARVTENYRRFLENRLRETLPLAEVPMRLLFRPRAGRHEARVKA
ncbi:MAG: ribosome biogenesis GTPase Der [Phycisphaerae bacterium]